MLKNPLFTGLICFFIFGCAPQTPSPAKSASQETVIDRNSQTASSTAATTNTNLTTPTTLRLEPGDYQFKLSKEGYAPLEFKVSVARNKKQTISATDATLRKLEGFVMVSSKPYEEGARVFVDGTDQGEVPAQLTLAVGAHEIEVRKDGKAGKESITLKDGQTLTLELELKEQASGDFVLVKGGCFQMGDIFGEGGSDEKPVHKVCLDDFYLGKTEVTQGQWQKVMGNNPSNFKNGDNYPEKNRTTSAPGEAGKK
ncbi:PEGA domain-containing protein [Deltaproteobacteria bacterium TL4]